MIEKLISKIVLVLLVISLSSCSQRGDAIYDFSPLDSIIGCWIDTGLIKDIIREQLFVW